ncbi:HAD family hydrolase [Plebeiibacterium sediminum]|uniref:HAD family hydrolase n=1 Tax=Plebeiibacterium sediminum TaxID=2992112 RepID=A0AAE3M2S8_9BACT|nr:HAD family hydrolase [Plebeiobacterium sediminum]MCW3785787.1 HAD family hydrolase [Plebeiobacterium sediminum]
MNLKFKWIGFDADDTLWENESYFREAEEEFCKMLKDYATAEELTKALYDIEVKNIKYYGYGIKGFVLSMIETGMQITDGKLSGEVLEEIISLGKELLNKPVCLIDGVAEVLESLKYWGYKLVVVTKGDLLDQEKKLQRSGLEKYFHHIEIVSDKQEENYQKLLNHLDVKPKDFLMVGNSLKSDVLPVLNIGGSAIHIPFHTTWIHEHVENVGELDHFCEIKSISEIHHILSV